MITLEALDVILRVQNLPGFMARMKAGANSVRGIGAAAVDSNRKTSAALMATARKATLGLAAISAIALAAGYKQSVEFEKQMMLVHTQAGRSMSEMKDLSNRVLEFSKSARQTPIELSKALFGLSSIGLPTKDLMGALKVASEGAAVGLSDVEDTANALAGAWLANIKGGGDMEHIMSTLNATVGAGNLRMDDLVTAMGTGVLPASKVFGLSLQDVMGALALLTDEGMGAYGAMAQFATALHFIGAPTEKARKAMRRMGLDELELAETMRSKGMIAALTQLRDSLKNFSDDPAVQADMLSKILPGGRGRVMLILMNQLDRYQMKLDQIQRTTGGFAKAVKDTQETAAFKIDNAWAKVQRSLIKLGDTFRDEGTGIVVFALGAMAQLIDGLTGLVDNIDKVVAVMAPLTAAFVAYRLVVLGAAAATALLAGMQALLFFGSLVAEFGLIAALGLVFAPVTLSIGLVALAIAALVALIVIIIMHWDWVKQAGVDTWHWIKQAAIDAWHWIKQGGIDTFNWIKSHWNAPLVILLTAPFRGLINFMAARWPWIKNAASNVINFFKQHWGTIKTIIVSPFELAIRVVTDRVRSWIAFFRRAYSAMIGPAKDMIKWIGGAAGSAVHWALKPSGLDPNRRPIGGPGGYTGGMVTSGGAMTVGEHGPETVVFPTGARIAPAGFRSQPGGAAVMATGGGAQAFDLHNHIYLDGNPIANSTARIFATKKARK